MNVVLKLSKLCNLRCTYCYEYEHLAERTRMPLDGLARFLGSLGEYLAANRFAPRLRFALHGGEPLLLPPAYLEQLVALQREHLGARGIAFDNAIQTNLYKVPAGMPDLLQRLRIRLGVSLDVHGDQRLTAAGRDAEDRVRRNLDDLIASGAAQRIGVGGISVLHAGNVDRAVDTFHYFSGRGLDYRILPIFSMGEPPARMRGLMLEPEEIVGALQRVFRAWLSSAEPRITVYPVQDHFEAAVRHGRELVADVYDPAQAEWALIVDTNGDAYTHSDAYEPGHCLGNVFRQPVAAVLDSDARRRLLSARATRAETCARCRFGQACSRIPVIEALPSERRVDAAGRAECTVAQPLIAWMTELIAQIRPAAAGAAA